MNWPDLVASEITRLADVTDGVDPATPVPTCDDWTVADLLEHAGTIYRWAATMVRDRAQERLRREQMDWATPSSPDGWPGWIRDGRELAVDTFRAADPSVAMWAWGTPKTAAFWPRRMVHEIGVHRADAELAVGITPSFDADVATDGIAELLDNLPHAESFAPSVARLRGDHESIGLRAGEARWRIDLLADRYEWTRRDTEDDCDVVVSASTAGALLLTMYGRPAPATVEGDESLWERWRTNSAI